MLMAQTQPSFNLLTILGPTASGKTRLAVALAKELTGEIISADSRQVFRQMDIGSGKDLHEYGEIAYHLIDIIDPGQEFSVFAFQRLFIKAFEEISASGKLPVLCGGTGLYLDAALRGYRMVEVPEDSSLRAELAQKSDEELIVLLQQLIPNQHNNSDLTDRNRTIRAIEIASFESQPREEEPFPVIQSLIIGILWDRAQLRQRITKRLRQRLETGLLEEVQSLHASGIPWERLEYYGLEYRFVAAFLQGKMNRNDLFQKLNAAIHDFAKRQETWFRRMERNGMVINWVDGAGDVVDQAGEIIRRTL
jgi:tRNA dimethylallyltransferase